MSLPPREGGGFPKKVVLWMGWHRGTPNSRDGCPAPRCAKEFGFNVSELIIMGLFLDRRCHVRKLGKQLPMWWTLQGAPLAEGISDRGASFTRESGSDCINFATKCCAPEKTGGPTLD